MPHPRRQFLIRAGALGLALPFGRALLGCEPKDSKRSDAADALPDGGDTTDSASSETVEPLPDYTHDGPLGPEGMFTHGVASGDPLHDRVILWTRITTEDDTVPVFWEIALDVNFADRVGAGWTEALEASDHCVKVDATGLENGTTYYYRFFALGRTSPIGRTKTAASGPIDRMRMALCSCSNLVVSTFHAYREIAEMPDLELVVHLGDYIYEYGYPDIARPTEPPHELITLADYRMRYAQYRREAELQNAHRQHPWVVVWDDHEFVNNAAINGGTGHLADDGPWEDRRAAATQAWHEWMPVRETPDRHIYRAFEFGDLVHLLMLDTRIIGRDPQVSTGTDESMAEDRQVLGSTQERWLFDELARTSARWTLLGQQVMMSQLQIGGVGINPDQWDGYPAARQRLFDAVKSSRNLQNLVVLTGDIHSSWANDLTDDLSTYDPETGAGALGVEVIVPGVTSPGFASEGGDVLEAFRDELRHVQWADLGRRGYVVLDIDRDRLQAAWNLFESIDGPLQTSTPAAAWSTKSGAPHFVEDAAKPPPRGPPLAP
jgi:alkaline phosphatase D